MADVFISSLRSGRQIAEAISRELSASGISTFFAEESIVFGRGLTKQLEEHIQKSRLTIVIWSEEAAKSAFFREEIRVALEAWENERLFLAKVDNAELPIGLRDTYYHDYSRRPPDQVAASIASDVLRILSRPDLCSEEISSRRSGQKHPPSLSAWKHEHFPTWLKYSIAILILVALAGLGLLLPVSIQESSQPVPVQRPSIDSDSEPSPMEDLSVHPPEDAVLLANTIAIILILLVIFLVVGLVVFFKRRRRLLAPAQTRSVRPYEHNDFGFLPEGILFISYSRDDRPKVYAIVNKLEQFGLKIWLDTRREADAQRFAKSIVQAIRASEACAFMCSSTAYSSDHVVRELYLADKYSKPMIPVEIETCPPSEDFEYFFSGLEFIPYKPLDRCVQVIMHRLQSAQPPKSI